MKKHWWKALGVLILLYVLTAGMLVPLKPGIARVEPKKAIAGQLLRLKVWGYNTNFKKAEGEIRAWLKLNDAYVLGSEGLLVKNDQEMTVIFQLSGVLPVYDEVTEASLVLDNPVDGAIVLPAAVFVKQDVIDVPKADAIWENTPIQNLHTKKEITFPFRNILTETIRNTYFHVALWLAMVILLIGSVVYSILYLRNFNSDYDRKAVALTSVGLFYGILGIVTGAIWAKNTWGAYWSWDVKQNTTAIALLIYAAYFVLRNAFSEDPEKKARLAAVYNIFAFVALIPLIYVIPRMTDSLHPGAGGNPALGGEDLDNTMRLIFYPAVIGWALLGLWIAQLSYRITTLKAKLLDF